MQNETVLKQTLTFMMSMGICSKYFIVGLFDYWISSFVDIFKPAASLRERAEKIITFSVVLLVFSVFIHCLGTWPWLTLGAFIFFIIILTYLTRYMDRIFEEFEPLE